MAKSTKHKEDRQLFGEIYITRDGEVSFELTKQYADADIPSIRNIVIKVIDSIFANVWRSHEAMTAFIAKHEGSRIVDISGQKLLNSESIKPSPN